MASKSEAPSKSQSRTRTQAPRGTKAPRDRTTKTASNVVADPWDQRQSIQNAFIHADPIESLPRPAQLAVAGRMLLRVAPALQLDEDHYLPEECPAPLALLYSAVLAVALQGLDENAWPASLRRLLGRALRSLNLNTDTHPQIAADRVRGALQDVLERRVMDAVDLLANGSSEMIECLWEDLRVLQQAGGRVAGDFYARPLWAPLGNMPEGWSQVLSDWATQYERHRQQALVRHYQQLWQGGGMDTRSATGWAYAHIRAYATAFGFPLNTQLRTLLADYGPEQQLDVDSAARIGSQDLDANVAADGGGKNQPAELMGRVTGLGDEVAEVDLLDRAPLVEALAAMLADPAQHTPFTLALLGDWGAGKSSLMHLLRKRLLQRADQARFRFATFNAWAYEHTDNMAAGLAQEVLKGLVAELGLWARLRLRFAFAWHEYGGQFLMALLGLGFLLGTSALLGVTAVTTEEARLLAGAGSVGAFGLLLYIWLRFKDIYQHPLASELNSYLRLPQYLEHLGLVPVLQRHIRTLCALSLGRRSARVGSRRRRLLVRLTAWRPGSYPVRVRYRHWLRQRRQPGRGWPRRLILFVDDLDRCQPDCIARCFDAIRLVMDVAHVVVVIGVDPRVAFLAVEKQYESLVDPVSGRDKAAVARDYMGKIIQLPVTLDHPLPITLGGFVRGKLFATAVPAPAEESGEESQAQTPPRTTGEPAAQTKPQQRRQQASAVADADADADAGAEVDGAAHADPAMDNQAFTLPPSADSAPPPGATSNDLLTRAMRDTAAESDHFIQLLTGFGLANPRQLTRLHNSYRLLKLLRALHQVQASNEQLLAMLFWLEHLNSAKPQQRAALEAQLLGRTAPSGPPNALSQQISALRQQFVLQDGDTSVYNELNLFVRRLVLPHSSADSFVAEQG